MSIQDDLIRERCLVACIQKLSTCDRLEESISQVLNTIIQYYKGDRGYIFEFDWHHKSAKNTYEKCANGVSEEIHNLQELPLSMMQVWVDSFEKQDSISIVDVDAIADDPDRKIEHEMLIMQGIRSLVAVPFYCNGILSGFLGVDDPKVHHDDVEFLMNLTYFISNEIEKRRMNERLID